MDYRGTFGDGVRRGEATNNDESLFSTAGPAGNDGTRYGTGRSKPPSQVDDEFLPRAGFDAVRVSGSASRFRRRRRVRVSWSSSLPMLSLPRDIVMVSDECGRGREDRPDTRMVSGSRRRWVFVFRFRGRTRQPRPCTRRSTFGFFFARFRLILVFILFFGLSFLLVRVPVVRGVPVHSGFAVNVTRIYESCSWKSNRVRVVIVPRRTSYRTVPPRRSFVFFIQSVVFIGMLR